MSCELRYRLGLGLELDLDLEEAVYKFLRNFDRIVTHRDTKMEMKVGVLTIEQVWSRLKA